MSNANKEALVAVERLAKFDLSAVGINPEKLISPDKARAALARNGIPVKGLSDVAAQLVQAASVSLERVSTASYNASIYMGVLSDCEAWKAAFAPDGKRYKSENAYLRDFFPGYAVSTTSIYADVGKTVYLPILQHKPGYEGLEYLLEVSPSNVKFLLNTIKDDEKRALLPEALEKAQSDGKITQRIIGKIAKDIKDKVDGKSETANLPDGTDNSKQVKSDLQGGTGSQPKSTVEARVRMCYMAAVNDVGELASVTPEQHILEFLTLLTNGAGDANVAMTICSEMAKIVTAATKLK